MEKVGVVLAVIVGVLFWCGIFTLLGWLIYRWCIKFTPYSRRATIILCFIPLFNFMVTWPLMAGKEVGWKDGNTAGAIAVMFLCGWIGWLGVLLFWLARRSKMPRANAAKEEGSFEAGENIGEATVEAATEPKLDVRITKDDAANSDSPTASFPATPSSETEVAKVKRPKAKRSWYSRMP